MHLKKWIIAILLIANGSLLAQEVTVSKAINVRSDYSYSILGKIKDHILLFRDKGTHNTVEVFDSNLGFKYDRKLTFESRSANIIGVIPADTTFSVFYAYRKKGKNHIRVRKYNRQIDLIDTSTILKEDESFSYKKYRLAFSENKSKVALFNAEKGDKMKICMADVDSSALLWKKVFTVKKYNLRKDFRKICVTDRGEALVLFESNKGKFGRNSDNLLIVKVSENDALDTYQFDFDDVVSSDLEMNFDNFNRRVAVAGLYSSGNINDVEGYYIINEKLSDLQEENVIKLVPFGLDFIAEVYGKKIGKEKKLKNYSMENLTIRRDGGLIFMSEMNKRYNRRSAFGNGISRYNDDYFQSRGWTDYYNEDIVLIALHPSGEEHWRSVLYKKQFSQDDQGIYSSFFVFKTPSRMRIVYNDEIKNSNTVSEYVLSPLGDYERNSVLSTDYQNLKLRFRDAIQISSNEMIVPSEKNYNLSLVRVRY